jgi:hypothetical protein
MVSKMKLSKQAAPVEVVRKGRVLKIVPETKPDKLSRLKKRDYIVGDPEDFVHIDWRAEWSETKNLHPLPHGRGSESE